MGKVSLIQKKIRNIQLNFSTVKQLKINLHFFSLKSILKKYVGDLLKSQLFFKINETENYNSSLY